MMFIGLIHAGREKRSMRSAEKIIGPEITAVLEMLSKEKKQSVLAKMAPVLHIMYGTIMKIAEVIEFAKMALVYQVIVV